MRQITHYDNFLRNHATSQELSQLPWLAYGSESDPQAFFIFIECLHPFQDNFRALVSARALKDCRSLKGPDGFIAFLRHANNESARRSDEQEKYQGKMRLAEKPKETREKLKTQEQQQKFVDGRKDRQLAGTRTLLASKKSALRARAGRST